MLARDGHRRGTETVPGKHAGNARTLAQLHHQQVLALLALDVRFRNAQRNARNGQQLCSDGLVKIDWHLSDYYLIAAARFYRV